MPINQALLDILKNKPFETEEAKAALDALIVAFKTDPNTFQTEFAQALIKHKSFWNGVRVDLIPLDFSADGLVLEGVDANKEANNLKALWSLALKKYGYENVIPDILRIHRNMIQYENPQNPLLSIYNQKIESAAANIRYLHDNDTYGDFDQKSQLRHIVDTFTSNELELFSKKLKTESNYLERLYATTSVNDFKAALGFKINNTSDETIERLCILNTDAAKERSSAAIAIKSNLQEAITAANVLDPSLQSDNAILKQSKFKKVHVDAFYNFVMTLPLAQEEIVVNKIKNNPPILREVLQATTSTSVARLLNIDISQSQNKELETLITINRSFVNFKNQEINNKNANLNIPKPIPPRGDEKSFNYKHFEQDINLNVYQNFNKYMAFYGIENKGTFRKDGKKYDLDLSQQANLQDALAVSGNLAEFRACIKDEKSFLKVINKAGGFFGKRLRSYDQYYLDDSARSAFDNMTEQEFAHYKDDAIKKRIEVLRPIIKANPKNDYVREQLAYYFELDQKNFLDPLQADFEKIQKGLPAFKKELNDLFDKEEDTSFFFKEIKEDKPYLTYQDFETATPEEAEALKKAIQEALIEGQAIANALNLQLERLATYKSHLLLSTDKRTLIDEQVEEQIEYVENIEKAIRSEKTALENVSNFRADLMAKIEGVITDSKGTTRQLRDDTDFWKTTIRAVDAAHVHDRSKFTANNQEDPVVFLGDKPAPIVSQETAPSIYETVAKSGQVLEYLVECNEKNLKTPSTRPEDKNGVFRKSIIPDTNAPGKDNISLQITQETHVPKDENAQVALALRMAAEYKKYYEPGKKAYLDGKNAAVVADIFHALLAVGVARDDIVVQTTCAFDPSKHKSKISGFTSDSIAGISEAHFKNNSDAQKAAKKMADNYTYTHQDSHAHRQELMANAKRVVQEGRKMRKAVQEEETPVNNRGMNPVP